METYDTPSLKTLSVMADLTTSNPVNVDIAELFTSNFEVKYSDIERTFKKHERTLRKTNAFLDIDMAEHIRRYLSGLKSKSMIRELGLTITEENTHFCEKTYTMTERLYSITNSNLKVPIRKSCP